VLRRNRGAFRDDSPVSRSNFSAAAKQGAIRQKELKDSRVFSDYGSGVWGSGDEQINEVRRPIWEVKTDEPA